MTVTGLGLSTSYTFRLRAGVKNYGGAVDEYHQHDSMAVYINGATLERITNFFVVNITDTAVELDWDDLVDSGGDVTYIVEYKFADELDIWPTGRR